MHIPNTELSPLRDREREESLSLSLSLSLPLWRKKIENFGHSSFVFILHEKETNVNVFGISNFFPR
jgi:hypothetical protein